MARHQSAARSATKSVSVFNPLRQLSKGKIANEIVDGRLVASLENPSRAGQEIFVIWIQDYTWVVPFVIEEDGALFLKTAFPSRKLHRRYGGSYGQENQP